MVTEYHERVLTPWFWISQADELIDASRKLEPGIKKYWRVTSKYFDRDKGTYSPPPGFEPGRLLQSTYFMLVAYAIENYFKAILIVDFTETYRDEILRTGKLPEALKDHDLARLAQKSGFPLNNDEERSVLARVYRNSLWQGRYPVPVNANQLNSMAACDGKAVFTAFLGPADMDDLSGLVRRIEKVAYDKVSATERSDHVAQEDA